MKKLVTFVALTALLAACTAGRPPDYRGMPARDTIQAGEEIIVGNNQNVYAIARKHGVSMREIIVLNDLKPPFALKAGQRLVLPAKGGDEAPPPAAAPLDAIEKAPLAGAVASSSASSITAEPLDAPQALPPSEPVPTAPAPGTAIDAPPKPAPAKPLATTVTPAEPAKVAAAEPAKTPEVPAPGAALFAWPVQGPILSPYGAKGQGLSNDGINIGAPKGAPVSAASGGIVVYAGNEMKGFGNLVLIRHEGGWVTAYAHLDRMMVNKDTIVAPGDMIGTVGTTGGVTSPQLHFETRLDGKAVDPQTVIKGS